MTKFNIIANNEFYKTFDNGKMKFYINKEKDEETNKYIIICRITKVKNLNPNKITFTYIFDTEKERDEIFKTYDSIEVDSFVNQIIQYIN